MHKEVLLFAEEIVCDNRPLFHSAQGQVFFGTCPQTKQKIVVKQINLKNNPAALVKELQVFQLFVNRIELQMNQDEIGPQRADSRPDCNIRSEKSFEDVKLDDIGKIEEIISKPDMFQMIKGVPRILGFTYT